jgi:hypothetical protein
LGIHKGKVIASEFNVTPCLFELAATGRLPDHQFMDERTLNWIESSEHALFAKEALSPLNQQTLTAASVLAIINRFIPSVEWYSNPSLADSIHGLRHTLRVIVLAQVVAETVATSALSPHCSALFLTGSPHWFPLLRTFLHCPSLVFPLHFSALFLHYSPLSSLSLTGFFRVDFVQPAS